MPSTSPLDNANPTYSPSNYTPADNTLEGHLEGIDAGLGGGGGGGSAYFSAKMSSNLSVTAFSTTVVSFDTVIVDNNSDYNTSTYRFTPSVAGDYIIMCIGRMNTGPATTAHQLRLRKNGTEIRANNYGPNSLAQSQTVFSLASANGSTDYFDVAFVNGYSSTNTILATNCEFIAFKL